MSIPNKSQPVNCLDINPANTTTIIIRVNEIQKDRCTASIFFFAPPATKIPRTGIGRGLRPRGINNCG